MTPSAVHYIALGKVSEQEVHPFVLSTYYVAPHDTFVHSWVVLSRVYPLTQLMHFFADAPEQYLHELWQG